MRARPRLSICIPTYNRARFLPDALSSLLPQLNEHIEVVVSDNASTDNTSNVINDWRRRIPNLSYSVAVTNQGADRNFLRVIEQASGEYCWLLGSDDALAPEALQTVLSVIDRKPAVVVTDRTMLSIDFARVLGEERMANAPDGTEFCINGPHRLADYFSSVHGFFGIFPFISNLIVNRETWLAQPPMDEFVGSLWIHAAKTFSILKSGGSLIYIARPLVQCRCGNDSFLASLGFSRRYLTNVGYLRLVDHFFGDTPDMHDTLTRIVHRRLFNWMGLMSARRHAHYDDPIHAAELDAAIRRILAERVTLWPRLLAWRFTPHPILEWLSRGRKGIHDGLTRAAETR